MSGSCYLCDVDKSTEPCIGCGKYICKAHSAGNNATYISLDDKKGRACEACVEEGVVGSAKGGIFNIMQPLNRIQYRFESKFYPKVYADIETLTDKIKSESFAEAHVLVKELEDSIKRTAETIAMQLEKTTDKMVADNLTKVENTLTHLTYEITKAIGNQRVEVSSDAEKIIRELSKAIQTSLIYVALIIVLGFAGIKFVLG